jgi:ERCC4-type nuclease
MSDITIIQDTREKKPWNFQFYGFNQEMGTLKTGDYTILGLEDIVRIERKRSTSEIAMNLGLKSKQFYAEMTRMLKFPHRYIICEFPYGRILEFPENSGIPPYLKKKVRMNGGFIGLSLEKLKSNYGMEIIFANSPSEAEEAAVEIFNRVIDEINAKDSK